MERLQESFQHCISLPQHHIVKLYVAIMFGLYILFSFSLYHRTLNSPHSATLILPFTSDMHAFFFILVPFNSVSFSKFAELCKHYYNLRTLPSLQKDLHAQLRPLPVRTPAPSKYSFSFCLYRFVFSVHFV